jgi:hypothetical protein
MPVSFEGSSLVIEMLEPQWEEAVMGVKPELLEKLRSATSGEVTQITVRRGQTFADGR